MNDQTVTISEEEYLLLCTLATGYTVLLGHFQALVHDAVLNQHQTELLVSLVERAHRLIQGNEPTGTIN
jgi:hypothetical protein